MLDNSYPTSATQISPEYAGGYWLHLGIGNLWRWLVIPVIRKSSVVAGDLQRILSIRSMTSTPIGTGK